MSRSTLRRPLVRTLAASTVALVALAGCSSNDSGKDGGSASSSSQQSDSSGGSGGEATSESSESTTGGAFDKEAAKAVLLTEADFPGYTKLDESQILSSAAQGSAATGQVADAMKIEPAECQELVKKNSAAMSDLVKNLDQIAMVMFTKTSATPEFAYEAIGSKSVLPFDEAMMSSAKCKNMTLDIGGIKGTASIEAAPIDIGSKSAALIQTTSIDAGGQKIETKTAISYVLEGDTVLSVMTSSNNATVDELVALTKKAYEQAKPVMK